MDPGVGVAVFICKEGKILLGQRQGSHGAGTWCLPGGHLEGHESWYDCAKREAYEETGLHLGSVRFARVTHDRFTHRPYITLFMVAQHVGGEPIVKEPLKCTSWRWFGWDALPEPLFLPLINVIKEGYCPFFGEVAVGVYQHYKGGKYRVLGVSRLERSFEPLVVYRALDPSEFGEGVLWSRPLVEFEQIVEVNGRHVPRFRYLGE